MLQVVLGSGFNLDSQDLDQTHACYLIAAATCPGDRRMLTIWPVCMLISGISRCRVTAMSQARRQCWGLAVLILGVVLTPRLGMAGRQDNLWQVQFTVCKRRRRWCCSPGPGRVQRCIGKLLYI